MSPAAKRSSQTTSSNTPLLFWSLELRADDPVRGYDDELPRLASLQAVLRGERKA